jgi:peptidylprolyl isomerase
MAVKKGDRVKVEYTGSLEDGTVFDSSGSHGQPLEFVAGAGHVVPGFDEAVIGMEKGEEKEIKLRPADAYGEPDPSLVKKLPRDSFPEEAEFKAGMTLGLMQPGLGQMPAKVIAMTENDVTLDLNHPLVGKVLIFKIKVVDVS